MADHNFVSPSRGAPTTHRRYFNPDAVSPSRGARSQWRGYQSLSYREQQFARYFMWVFVPPIMYSFFRGYAGPVLVDDNDDLFIDPMFYGPAVDDF